MRQRAVTAVAGTLAVLLLCSAPLLAKPTRTMGRPTPTTLRSSHGRASEKTAHVGRAAAHTAVNSRASKPAHTAVAAPVRARGTKHGRSVAAQAEIAARSAVLAADRTKGHGTPAARKRELAADEPRIPTHSASRLSESPVLANSGGRLRPLTRGEPMNPIEAAAKSAPLPSLRVASLYDDRGRLIVPAPLYGSHEVLIHQNEMADHDGLSRVRDDADLDDLRREKQLVPLPESSALTVDYRLPENRRYSRPWTADFLAILAHDYFAVFHAPLQVDSAVRTVAVQERLERTNGNAAPASGDTASPHLTGQAVDIAKGKLSRLQIAWLRTYLQPLIDDGKIDVEEEFQQACFHISVYKSFLPTAASRFANEAARQIPVAPLTGGSNP